MVELFVENQPVDLNESVVFTINRYFTDTSNPTNIYSEWTKTITIPFTVHNNQLFGSLYNVDRLIVAGGLTGLYFDPYKRLNFRLEKDGAIVLVGYLKVLSVDESGYQVTLNGELGRIFQDLKKITFDKSTEETDYLIDGASYYNKTMNRSLIINAWTARQDLIGWTPLNIRTDDETMNQKSFEKTNAIVKFTDTLDAIGFADTTGVPSDTAIPNGMMPREIGEFRSYLQQPYIRIPGLFDIMAAKCKSLTGYEFDLSDNWFTSDNDYWSKAVMLLNNFDASSDSFNSNSYQTYILGSYYTGNYYTTNKITINSSIVSESVPMYNTTTQYFNVTQDNATFNISAKIYLYLDNRTTADESIPFNKLAKDNALQVWFQLENADGTRLSTSRFIIANPDCTIIDEVLSSNPASTLITDESNNEVAIALWTDKSVGPVKLVAYTKWWNNNTPYELRGDGDMLAINFTPPDSTARTSYLLTVNAYSHYSRSGSTVTLNDLWDNSYAPFDMLVNYCKMFRIGIFCDWSDKKIRFIPYNVYFSNYTVTDWTNKLDLSQGYEIKPVTFENKYVLFNYDSNDSSLNAEYKSKYKFQFGEKNLVTAYEFNDSTTELFKGIKAPIESTDNILSWSNLYDYKFIGYSFPDEVYVYAKDKDGKLIDNFGTIYFDCGIVSFDSEPKLRLRQVYVSDDTTLQRSTNTYVYSQYTNRTLCNTYNKLSCVLNEKMVTFNSPNVSYSVNNYGNMDNLYGLIWSNYINEAYNVQNKLVTCYMDLAQSDFNSFDYNHFVTVGNQLYLVNKIFDFDINSNEPTKVELLTINDITGYTTIKYQFGTSDYVNIYYNDQNGIKQYIDLDSTSTIEIADYGVLTVETSKAGSFKWDNRNLYVNNTFIGTGDIEVGSNELVFNYETDSDDICDLYITIDDREYELTLIMRANAALTITYQDENASVPVILSNGQSIVIQEQGKFVVTTNAPLTWKDKNGTMQELLLNGTNGSGSIPAGTTTLVCTYDYHMPTHGVLEFTGSGVSFSLNCSFR